MLIGSIIHATETIRSLIICSMVLKRTALKIITGSKLLTVASRVLLRDLLDLLIGLRVERIEKTAASSVGLIAVMVMELVRRVSILDCSRAQVTLTALVRRIDEVIVREAQRRGLEVTLHIALGVHQIVHLAVAGA